VVAASNTLTASSVALPSRILIVDNNPALRERLPRTLSNSMLECCSRLYITDRQAMPRLSGSLLISSSSAVCICLRRTTSRFSDATRNLADALMVVGVNSEDTLNKEISGATQDAAIGFAVFLRDLYVFRAIAAPRA
jgi:hypothetical protein